MTINPFVSVCIPAYKYAELLDRCLKSILEQTYHNIEIIITDDSTDNQIENLIKPNYHDNRIKYFRNTERKGSPQNWNEAILKAKGEYIKIMHHDDWFAREDALEIMVKHITQNKADFAFCDCINVYPDRKSSHEVSISFFKKLQKEKSFILLANYIGDPSVTIYKNTLSHNTPILFDVNTKWYVDALFYYEYLSRYDKVIQIKEQLINITAGQHTQITNNDIDGKLVINECTYIINKFDLFNSNLSWLFKLHLLENFKKYKEPINNTNFKKNKAFGFLLKLPISYYFYTIIKHLAIRM